MDEEAEGRQQAVASWGVFILVAGGCVVTLGGFLGSWLVMGLGVAVGLCGGAFLVLAAVREGRREA